MGETRSGAAVRHPEFVSSATAGEAFRRMNSLGRRATPFLFVFDYALSEPHVLTENEIPADLRVAFPDHADVNAPSRLSANRSFTGGGPDGTSNRGSATGKDVAERRERPRILSAKPVDFARYREGFETVQRGQRSGNSYLANLTFPSEVTISGSFDDVFEFADAPYRLKFGERFVCFSPECFVRISGRDLRTFPMKGTREVAPGEDIDDEREALLADEKERAEHATVVDLLRNDIGRVAGHVSVPRYRYIERLRFPDRSLLAASSEIWGRLDCDWRNRIGDIIREMLPAGSVTGAPKGSTCRIIEEAEVDARGFYTGVFGYFDGRNLDSAVMIRFIERDGEKLRFRSGGGITIYSDAQSEYQELIDKVAIPYAGHRHAE